MYEIHAQLSRRERQILDILFELGEASAEQVRERLPSPPSNSATRALLARLEEKGHVRHVERDLRYVYEPAISREEARRSAVDRLVQVFFSGSLAEAVTGMVRLSDGELSEEELAVLETTIRDARREGSRP